MTVTASREISLNDIGRKYMSALQRLSDLMAYAWTGAHAANAQIYDQVPKALPGLPNTEFRMAYPAVQQEAERWVLHHSINEVLGLTLLFLDDIRKLCSLIAFNVARQSSEGDLTALAAEVNTHPGRVDLGTRLKNIKKKYNIVSPFEAEMLSLGGFATCMFRGAKVPKGSVLKLQLKCVQPSGLSGPQARLTDLQRAWGSDETLALTREQHAAIFTTVSVFFGAMLASVQDFAKLSGLPDTPPGP